jgi:hypothetical protein
MADAKKHTGSCHCGKVRFEVTTDLARVNECNCSHCSRKGFLLHFVPPEHFTLLSGEDQLTEYKFNRMVISHLFCRTCGVQSFGRGKKRDGTPVIALNVRCLEDVDPKTLAITQVDGRSF